MSFEDKGVSFETVKMIQSDSPALQQKKCPLLRQNVGLKDHIQVYFPASDLIILPFQPIRQVEFPNR